MSYTQTEIVGMSKNFLKLVDEAENILENGGMRTEDVKAVVSKKLEKAVDLNARQEAKKRELNELTVQVEAANDDLYRSTSGFLDACIGIAGKGSKTAKNFRRLRSRIRMPGDQRGEDEMAVQADDVPQPVK